jgi:hypothetical protein
MMAEFHRLAATDAVRSAGMKLDGTVPMTLLEKRVIVHVRVFLK